MIILKNISTYDIIINKKTIYPDKTVKVEDEQLEDLQKLIDDGLLEVQKQTVNRVEQKEITLNESQQGKYDAMKNRMIDAFFSHYFQQDLTIQQIEDLKWFYLNIGPTVNVSQDLKLMLSDVESGDELTEVLLNHIYPEMIKNYLSK
jgi:hypothetical protein